MVTPRTTWESGRHEVVNRAPSTGGKQCVYLLSEMAWCNILIPICLFFSVWWFWEGPQPQGLNCVSYTFVKDSDCVGCDDIPKELTGRFWLAVADLLSCRVQDEDEEDMSDQAMVGQAGQGMLALGDGNDSTDSQVVIGVANVHVDAVLL